jgi:hypothetical protein
MSIILAKLVVDGTITGSGPVDSKERALLLAQGWQPRSIKIGGTYYGYGRIEPIATILGLFADFFEIRKYINENKANKLAGMIAKSLQNNALDKTFFTGIMSLINAANDPDRYGQNWIQQMAGSVVPSLVAGTARAVDPNVREAKSIIDAVKVRIPFLSKTVEPRLRAFGEPAQKPGTVISRLLSPVPISKETKDPVYDELSRLGMTIGRPTMNIGGKKVDQETIRRLTEAAMPEVRKMALMIITSPLYQNLKDDEMKKKVLSSFMNRTRAFQRQLFILKENK